MGRFLLGITPLLIILSAGLGSIAPDFGHFLNLITGGQVSWSFGHSLSFWCWWTGTSLVGLVAVIILRKYK